MAVEDLECDSTAMETTATTLTTKTLSGNGDNLALASELSTTHQSDGMVSFWDDVSGTIARSASAFGPEAFLESKSANDLIGMGFDRDIIKKVIHLNVVETGASYSTTEALLDAVTAYQTIMLDVEEDSPTPQAISNKTSLNQSAQIENAQFQKENSEDKNDKETIKGNPVFLKSSSQTIANCDGIDGRDGLASAAVTSKTQISWNLKEENKKMKSQRRCNICLEADVQTVFLPCGHLVSCNACSALLTKCHLCNGDIKGSVKVFLS